MVYQLAMKNGMTCRRLNWNPNYKGIDDWQLALHRKRMEKKEQKDMDFKKMYLSGMCDYEHIERCIEQWHSTEGAEGLAEYLGLTREEYGMFLRQDPSAPLQRCLDSQRHLQRYRIYQLDLSGGKTVPFAFAGIRKMRDKGYEQPPASLYQLVYDGSILCPNEQSEHDILERVFSHYSDILPKDFPGRNVALSDVIELYGDNGRAYFYCDIDGFTGVKFSPMLAKPLNTDT